MIWAVGYILRWFAYLLTVIHPGADRAAINVVDQGKHVNHYTNYGVACCNLISRQLGIQVFVKIPGSSGLGKPASQTLKWAGSADMESFSFFDNDAAAG